MTDPAFKNLPRLYVPFTDKKNISLSGGQQHYLKNVMRLKGGDYLRVFNGQDGEWLAEVKDINKKNVIIALSKHLHEQKESSDVWVLASLVKKEALELMVEKASELGASRFISVISDYTVVHRMNKDRIQAIAIEAAEQCERMDILEVEDPVSLKSILDSWNKERKLIFCIERKGAVPIAEAVRSITGPSAILVGPEGGFSDAEFDLIARKDFTIPVSLGPLILRAETAMIAALACLQVLKQ